MGRRHAPKKTDVQTISGHACATSAQQKGTIIRPRLRDAIALASPTGRHRQAGFCARSPLETAGSQPTTKPLVTLTGVASSR